jgi:hypothetical protein
VPELDRLGDLAALDQLRLRLEQAEELLVVGDRLLCEHASSRLIAGMDRHVQEIDQLRPEPLDRSRRGAGADGDQGRIEHLRRPGEDPVGRVEERPVGVPEPLAEVAPLARGDLVDRAELFPHGAEQVLVLTPAALPQETCETLRRRYDRV